MKFDAANFTALLIALSTVVAANAQDQPPARKAILELIDEVDVATLDPGVVEKVNVKPGDQVNRGDVLIQLDRDRQRAELESAELAVQIADREFQNDVNIRFSEKTAALNEKQLQKSENAVRQYAKSISETELDRLRLELEKSTLSVEQAQLQREIAKLTVALREQEQQAAAINFDRREIKSPIEGTVVRVDIQQGESVTAGQPVIQVIRMDQLRLKTVLDVKLFFQVNDKTKAWFVRETATGETRRYPARVVFTNPKVEYLEQVFEVWLEVDNQDGELLPGLTGQVTWEFE